jgi:hypothetical protein
MIPQTIHGFRLANSSTADNFHVERLVADPVPVAAGRWWFNLTEKVMKYSSLDAGGAVIVKVVSDGGAVATDIAALQAALAAELVARAAGDTAQALYTDTKIADLVASAPAVLDTLQELATALENNPDIVNVLRTEVAAAIAAAKTELKGTVTEALDTLGEVETAIGAIDTRITTVEGQVNGNIGTLSTLTTDVKTTLVGAINEVDAHADAAAAAVVTEAARATAAEAAEATARADADTAEAAARLAADNAIKASVNGKNFTFQSGAAAAEHTITHNLNSPFILYSVLVEGTDLVYRNDLVPVEDTGVNSFKVYLSESRNIKVAVQSMLNV